VTLGELERVVAGLRARLHPLTQVEIDRGTVSDGTFGIAAVIEDRGVVIIRPDWGDEVPGLAEAAEERE
jgi:hypothetical protein